MYMSGVVHEEGLGLLSERSLGTLSRSNIQALIPAPDPIRSRSRINTTSRESEKLFDELTFENVNSSSVLVGSDTSGVVSVSTESTTLGSGSIGIAVESVLSSEHGATGVT